MSTLQVWLAPESLLDAPGVGAALESVLAADELERLPNFRAPTPRRLYLLARALQRIALSRRAPQVMPRDWRFVRTEAGRPSVSPEHGLELDFNLAHTQGLVALAVGAGLRVGIDAEGFEKRRSIEIARRYFSPREIAALEALPGDEQVRLFVELWTLKEAYLKAIGTGIAGGLGSMTFDRGDGGWTFERASDPDAARWRFRQWTRGEHALAVAWLAPRDVTVECREITAGELRAAASGQEQGSEA